MSSILKALQKLEQEKAVHQDTAGIIVSREILKQQPANSKLVRWFWIAGTAALVVISALSALLLTKPPRQSAEQSTPAAVTPAKNDGRQPATGPVVDPSIDTGRAVTAARAVIREKEQQLIRPIVLPPQPTSIRSSKTELPDTSAPPREPQRADTGRKLPQSGPPEQADTSLTLSGIAWNKDSADRLAIINGQATAIGATVNGALVEEIMPDRVKVQSAGRTYELFLGKPLKTN